MPIQSTKNSIVNGFDSIHIKADQKEGYYLFEFPNDPQNNNVYLRVMKKDFKIL